MSSTRRRAVVALATAAALSLGTASAAVAASKVPTPQATTVAAAKVPAPRSTTAKVARPAKAVRVASQVLLRVNPVEGTTTQFTARVTVKVPRGAVASGTVTVAAPDSGTVLYSGALANGTSVVVLDLEPGTHRLVARYSGNAKVNGASSKVVVVTAVEPVTDVVTG